MINIRQKGAEGEREVYKALNPIVQRVMQRLGFPAEQVAAAANCIQRNQNQSAVGGNDLSNLKMVAARPSRKGKLHPMFGKHHSVETIQLCRESNLGRKWWNYNGESRFAFEPPGQEWKPGRASFVRRTKEEIGKVKCL